MRGDAILKIAFASAPAWNIRQSDRRLIWSPFSHERKEGLT